MARTRTISAAELFDPIDVDIFGPKFRLRVPTRSSEEKVSANNTAIVEAAEDVAERDLSEVEARKILLPLYFEQLDLLLEPGEDDKGKKLHAKTVVKKLYDADKIGLVTINVLVEEIGKVRAEERRPT